MGQVESSAIIFGGSTIPIDAIATGTPTGSKFVRDDGTLQVPSGGGNSFGTVAVSGQSDVVADASADTLTLVAGANITITTDAGADTVTITGSGGGSGLTQPQVMARTLGC